MQQTPPLVSVVIPTFRESENLPILIPRVFAALTDAGMSSEVIVVDDDSADGTDVVCCELAEEYPVRLLIRQEERGLSSAVVHGIQHAQGDVIAVMDADLSHPPERLPALVEAITDPRHDFVIGSRYVAGGSTDDDWGLFRWLNSKIATLLARPLTSARDPMAGFFALRRETFAGAEQLCPIGYKIGLELLVKCGCRHVHEVPIQFSDRLHGESKLTFRQQVEYLKHLKRLYEFRMGRLAKPLQFALVGCSGVVVDVALLAAWSLVVPFAVARGLAIWGAMSWNCWLNRRLTFSYARTESAARQYVLFCLSCMLGALINWGLSVWLVSRVDFFATRRILAALCGIAAGTGINYVLSDRLAFRTGGQ